MTDPRRQIDHLLNESMMHFIMIHRAEVEKLFTKIPFPYYVELERIGRNFTPIDSEKKIYLKDIAAKRNVPMPYVSQMVKSLNDRGYVYWTHDGRGEEGTYIRFPEEVLDMIKEQDEIVRSFYRHVADKYGYENLTDLLGKFTELQKVVKKEMRSYQ